jgi:hypothetical protein
VAAREILSNIYIKNLNTEDEPKYDDFDFIVRLNKDLYRSTTEAIREACRHFGINHDINIHVYSANINHKIPQKELHEALKAGGASSVHTDPRGFTFKSRNNLGNKSARIKTNMHTARLEF